jgi:hypothetical protein
MKDYRRYTEPYKPNEWEEDEEWLIKRLDFLWTLSEYYPRIYIEKRFGEEKYNLYKFYEKLIPKANDINTSQYNEGYYLNMFSKKSLEDLREEFKVLHLTKEKNMDMFLRKRLYIKYYFLQDYISEFE